MLPWKINLEISKQVCTYNLEQDEINEQMDGQSTIFVFFFCIFSLLYLFFPI